MSGSKPSEITAYIGEFDLVKAGIVQAKNAGASSLARYDALPLQSVLSTAPLTIAWDGLVDDTTPLVTLSLDKKTVTFINGGKYRTSVHATFKSTADLAIAKTVEVELQLTYSAFAGYTFDTDGGSGCIPGRTDRGGSVDIDSVRNIVAGTSFTVTATVSSDGDGGSSLVLHDQFNTAHATWVNIQRVS